MKGEAGACTPCRRCSTAGRAPGRAGVCGGIRHLACGARSGDHQYREGGRGGAATCEQREDARIHQGRGGDQKGKVDREHVRYVRGHTPQIRKFCPSGRRSRGPVNHHWADVRLRGISARSTGPRKSASQVQLGRAVSEAVGRCSEVHSGYRGAGRGLERPSEGFAAKIHADSESKSDAIRPVSKFDSHTAERRSGVRGTFVADDSARNESFSNGHEGHNLPRREQLTDPSSFLHERVKRRHSRGKAKAVVSPTNSRDICAVNPEVVLRAEAEDRGSGFQDGEDGSHLGGYESIGGTAGPSHVAETLHNVFDQTGSATTSGSSRVPLGEGGYVVTSQEPEQSKHIHRILPEPVSERLDVGVPKFSVAADEASAFGVAGARGCNIKARSESGESSKLARAGGAYQREGGRAIISYTGSKRETAADATEVSRACVASAVAAVRSPRQGAEERRRRRRRSGKEESPSSGGSAGGLLGLNASIADIAKEREAPAAMSVLGGHVRKESAWKVLSEAFLYENVQTYASPFPKVKVHKTERVHPVAGSEMWPLDVPAVSVLNYAAIERLVQGETYEHKVKEALSWVTDPDAYNALHLPYNNMDPIICARKSHEFEPDLQSLKDKGFVTEIARSQVKEFVHGFTVPKPKKQTRRTILDGRPQNAKQSEPPHTQLPGLEDVIRLAQRFSFCREYDGTGWFHQFGLHPDIARHWVLRVGKGRYRWNRMPMGWSRSVYVAHTVAEALAAVTSEHAFILVYVDNVYVFGDTIEAVEQLSHAFEERCTEVGAQFSVSTDTTTILTVLGIEVNLMLKTIALPQKFIAKATLVKDMFDELWWERGSSVQRPTTHLIWRVFGALTWGGRILGIRSCQYPHWIAWLCRRAHQLAERPQLWHSPCGIWPSARRELHAFLDKILTNQPRSILRMDSVAHTLFTDASGSGYAIVHEGDLGRIVSRRWGPDMYSRPIAEKELYAVCQGVHDAMLHVPTHVRHFSVLCDNANVVTWCTRWRGKSLFSNRLLQQLAHSLGSRQLSVHWISTHDNIADEPSRR